MSMRKCHLFSASMHQHVPYGTQRGLSNDPESLGFFKSTCVLYQYTLECATWRKELERCVIYLEVATSYESG